MMRMAARAALILIFFIFILIVFYRAASETDARVWT
jgi:hypothetical protein